MPCLIILQEKCYLALHFRGKGIQLYYILLYVLNGLLFEMFQKAEKFFLYSGIVRAAVPRAIFLKLVFTALRCFINFLTS